jgi:hypothetical protein
VRRRSLLHIESPISLSNPPASIFRRESRYASLKLRKFEYRVPDTHLSRVITAQWRQLVALANRNRCRWPPPTESPQDSFIK